ncbi:MAG: hypothetical protein JNM63_05860, partial [Spirochaetia bacterium]|nr:hypothetical protein [Spirochaetia bacterium]
GKALPIWNSETGYSDSPWLIHIDPDIAPLDEELPDQLDSKHGAIATIQGEILQQAMGVERHFVYYQNIPPKPNVGEDSHCLEYTGAPRPKTIARAVLDRMLAGSKSVGPYVKRVDAGLWAFAWEWPNQSGCLTVLWSEKGSRLEIAVPESAKALYNLMGNTRELKASLEVNEEPRYLRLSIPAKEALAFLQKMPVKVVEKSAQVAAASAEDKPKVPVLPAYPGPDEAGPGKTFFVDLSRVANFGFADEKPGDRQGGWTDEGPLNDFRDFPTGFQRFYNVPFKILDPAKNDGRSILTLYGKNATPSQPRAVSNIPIGGKVRALYFLHAAGWGTPGKIGTYRMTYADGTTAVLEQEIPIHNHNWWNGYDAKELSRPVPIHIKNTATGKPEWRYARIYEWQNPSPENPIVSLAAESAGGAQTPVLIAVTGIRW